MDFNNLDANSIKDLLKNLRLYRDLTKKLWYRWKRIFDKIKNWKSYYLVEYFPSINEDFVSTKALEIYKKVFGITPNREEIIFMAKESILWWIKVYMDDNVVDLSFAKIEKKLKK